MQGRDEQRKGGGIAENGTTFAPGMCAPKDKKGHFQTGCETLCLHMLTEDRQVSCVSLTCSAQHADNDDSSSTVQVMLTVQHCRQTDAAKRSKAQWREKNKTLKPLYGFRYCSNSLGWKQVSFQGSDSVKDCIERTNMHSFSHSLWESVPESRLMMLGFWFKSSPDWTWRCKCNNVDPAGSLCLWPPHENTHPIRLHTSYQATRMYTLCHIF